MRKSFLFYLFILTLPLQSIAQTLLAGKLINSGYQNNVPIYLAFVSSPSISLIYNDTIYSTTQDSFWVVLPITLNTEATFKVKAQNCNHQWVEKNITLNSNNGNSGLPLQLDLQCCMVGLDFSYNLTTNVPANIQFQTQLLGNQTPINLMWDFGDGQTNNALNPSHTFTQAGIYTVCVSAEDNLGCLVNRCEYLAIGIGKNLTGFVDNENHQAEDYEVLLFEHDTINQTYSKLQTQQVSGNPAFFGFYNLNPLKQYYLKSEVALSSINANQYIPSYFEANTTQQTQPIWSEASSICPLCFPSTTDNIAMELPSTLNFTGSGKISGNVYGQANQVVLLRDSALQSIAFTRTDATGFYEFNNLAFGNYQIYPEVFGYYSTPYTTNLSNSSNTQNLSFITQANYITPFMLVGNQPTFDNEVHFQFYPNPASDVLTIEFKEVTLQKYEISIRDIYGQKVTNQTYTTHEEPNLASINIKHLASGIYFLQLENHQTSTHLYKWVKL